MNARNNPISTPTSTTTPCCGLPPPAPRPLLARLTAPAGPPDVGVWERAGARVMAVPGKYSVTYLVIEPDAVVIADVGSLGDIPRILEALRWLGRSPEDVRYVTPTHLHFDHVMGMDGLARQLRIAVALGRTAYRHVVGGERLRWPPPHHLVRSTYTWIMQGMPFPPLDDWKHGLDFGFPWSRDQFRARLGPILEHRADLPFMNGWQVLATPGHAEDAICLHHAEAGFLVAGDTVRNFLGGEWNPIRCSQTDFDLTRRLLLSLHVETVFPAHGPVLEGPWILHELAVLPPWMP